MTTMVITLIIFVLMIVSFSINKKPMALTAMIGAVLLVMTGCVDASQILSSAGSGTVFTMAAMFIIAAGLRKTQLVPKLSQLVNKVSKGSFTAALAGYVLVTFILGQFIPSTTALFALVCPLAVAICEEMGFSKSKMIYPIGLVTVTTAYTITPIGPYVGNYIENNGLLAEYGITGFENTIFTETSIKLPVSIVILLWAIFVAPKFAAFKDETALNAAKDITIEKKNDDKGKEIVAMPRYKEMVMYGVFAVVVISLIFNSFGFPVWLIPAIGACIITAVGVLNEKEAIGNMGLSIILLYIGVATLGNAFSNTGAGELIGNAVMAVLGNTRNSYLIGGVFFFASFIMTSLIYNRAVGKILIPIALATCASLKCDPRGIMQMCYIGSMSSLITPMSTSIVPMMMEAGGYTQKSLIKMGWLTSLVIGIVTVAVGMTMYPCF